jgi:hypothetical protein
VLGLSEVEGSGHVRLLGAITTPRKVCDKDIVTYFLQGKNRPESDGSTRLETD